MKKENDDLDKGNLIIPDSNVFLNEPYVLNKFIDGTNHVVVPLKVVEELDNKKKDPRLGPDAKIAIREIDKFTFLNSESFRTEMRFNFSGLDLNKNISDYKIIATLNYILKSKEYSGYKKYKLITDDCGMRVVAHAIFKNNPLVSIETYKSNQVIVKKSDKEFKTLSLELNDLSYDMKLHYDPDIFGEINQNSGIIIEYDNGKKNLFTRSGDFLVMIKNDFSLFGLKAINGDDQPNYGQLLAFNHLSNKNISCVFLEGKAGTGKTLIALAGALAQKDLYEQIIVANPMVPLSNKSTMGFLPGDIDEKSSPWLLPFEQNLRFLENNNPERMRSLLKESKTDKKNKNSNGDSNGTEEKLYKKYKISFQPLEYIRGQTISNSFIIIEEAQNLTPHEIKTIITRLGEGSKIVFCGDLKQIDVPYLSENSSGLIFAIEKMTGESLEAMMVGVSRLTRSVRSRLVYYASRVL